MSKLSKDQVYRLNGVVLNEQVAVALGWEVARSELLCKNRRTVKSYKTSAGGFIPFSSFSPAVPSLEGTSQCFDLLERFNLSINREDNYISYGGDETMRTLINGNLQRAICQAVVMYNQCEM